jgi:hypothetical protein
MPFNKKPDAVPENSAPPPPWENIDKTKVSKSTGKFRFNLMEFIEQATGFGKFGTRLLMLGLAIALGFVAYIVYFTAHQGLPPPPDVNRPAMDKFASTTRLTYPSQQ